MPNQEEVKSLSDWRVEIHRYGKNHWLKFYASLLGSTVSSPPRFFRGLSLYGEWALFEAIVATSNATLTGDPLAYVLKVASIKWKEAQQDEEEETLYLEEIEQAKKESQKQNDTLAKKLKKAGKK